MKLFYYVKKVLTKPPHIVVKRLIVEIVSQSDRFFAPYREKAITESSLCREFSCGSIFELWNILGKNKFPVIVEFSGVESCALQESNELACILAAAEQAMNFDIDILGSGLINLGEDIQWNKDYKSGFNWPNHYIKSIDYNNPERTSDVKMAWELSRLQWLIPVAQSFVLTGDEKYAEFVKSIILHWTKHNPYAFSVNWACTMEPAMRVFVWSWFFHVFKNSKAWDDAKFRFVFLKTLFLHGDFIDRHFEMSDINGNHCTADAAALVSVGLFFKGSEKASKWHDRGWDILQNELPKQVGNDGADFEASIPYHRLVTELFFFPAIYREACGLNVSQEYKGRVVKMAEFTKAYMRSNGTSPLLGDADDARLLPFGTQETGNHFYLYEWVGLLWDKSLLSDKLQGMSELIWLISHDVFLKYNPSVQQDKERRSQAFHDSGYFVMRNEQDHVFIDCAPVGLAGRGGHGHNDCLSFELSLKGQNIISDSGAYVYTESYKERDLFRSTAYHSTPKVDGEEINRFISPDFIWNLKYDAIPKVHKWSADQSLDVFIGSHSGYHRLKEGITPVRKIELHHEAHKLVIEDKIEGAGVHEVEIPFHLSSDVTIVGKIDQSFNLITPSGSFVLSWKSNCDWSVSIEDSFVSTSYGVKKTRQVIVFKYKGNVPVEIECEIKSI